MQPDDWNQICRSIYEGRCILMIGSEFPVQFKSKANNKNNITSFAELFCEDLIDGIVKVKVDNSKEIPGNEIETAKNRIRSTLPVNDFTQLATRYTKLSSKYNLENLITEFYLKNLPKLHSPIFRQLMTLPFGFVVDTNHGHFFSNECREIGKKPKENYYNFKKKESSLASYSDKITYSLGDEKQPFFYHLFGSINKPESLVVSENDLIQFIINVISKSPGLHNDVKSQFLNTSHCFLFIGFAFMSKNWYFRILLNSLDSGNKEPMSYALDRLENYGSEKSLISDPTVLFFRDQLKVSLWKYDASLFVKKLVTEYKLYNAKRDKYKGDQKVSTDAPKVFVSYKTEDYERVKVFCDQLRATDIETWLDKKDLDGLIDAEISDAIKEANAYIVVSSENLMSHSESYVYIEAKEAAERAKAFPDEGTFLFPCYMGSPNYRFNIPSYPIYNKLLHTNIDNNEEVGKLIESIKRAAARRQ